MSEKLDDLDKKILSLLLGDARISYRELARNLKVSVNTVIRRINDMKERGVLLNFIPLIDAKKVGLDVTVIVGIVVEGGHLVEVERELARRQEVCAVYDVTGEFDAIVVAKFKNTTELNAFIKSTLGMKHVQRTCTFVVLNVVKEDYRVYLPE
ncbi:MAG: DNA-binding transcriptional regulator [Candidatus Alkanophagales archaeon MCA70_species_2]|nr:DNA-binding transcriptional regulator [Candidatus Alkanophaga liquidiphilum]RLG38646.1 MAG: AsnC family transcriptional regulator [Candidatus Alkanophagales archaeon]